MDPQILAEGKFLRFVNEAGWEYAQRKGISGIVVLIAVTNEGKLLLVEQYRPPVGARVIELPAGLAGDIVGSESEPLAAAAHRELLEETGYRAKEMHELFKGPPAPGMSSEVVTLFQARGLEKVGPGGGDESEDIVVHEVPLDEVVQWTTARCEQGIMVDPKVFTGVYFSQSGRGGER